MKCQIREWYYQDMELRRQVVSQELAEQLLEIGVKEDSQFYWIRDGSLWRVTDRDNITPGANVFVPAYTAPELGEILSKNVIEYSKDGNMWVSLYGINLQDGHGEFAETEADSRAKLLIWLIENRLLRSQLPTPIKR
jgi:hypothetical protein